MGRIATHHGVVGVRAEGGEGEETMTTPSGRPMDDKARREEATTITSRRSQLRFLDANTHAFVLISLSLRVTLNRCTHTMVQNEIVLRNRGNAAVQTSTYTHTSFCGFRGDETIKPRWYSEIFSLSDTKGAGDEGTERVRIWTTYFAYRLPTKQAAGYECEGRECGREQ